MTELAATTSPHNHHLSSLHPCDHPCEPLKSREEVVGGSTSSSRVITLIGGTSNDHMAKDREVILGWAFLKKHSGGIQSEIIAPVESSLSDYVFETDFLLVSDYSLCKPHVQTCGGMRAHPHYRLLRNDYRELCSQMLWIQNPPNY